jgi:hypothetical protein
MAHRCNWDHALEYALERMNAAYFFEAAACGVSPCRPPSIV